MLSSSKVESKELNENMYLVVRSLKNNNQKIVSVTFSHSFNELRLNYLTSGLSRHFKSKNNPNHILIDFRITKSSKVTF